MLVHYPGLAIKAVPRGNGIIEGHLIPWGSAMDNDLEGQWFTKNTDLRLDWFSDHPILYHHGMDATVRLDPIGRVKSHDKDDIGLWVQGQLDLADRYAREVYDMIQTKQFGWSSGSVDHLVKIARSGEIMQWPLIEGSVTPTPAQPHKTTVRALKSILLPNDPVSQYLRELDAGADESDERSRDVITVKSANNKGDGAMYGRPSTKTQRYVYRTLKNAGFRPTKAEVRAIAADLEDEEVATMQADFEDEAMLADFEDDAMMQDDEAYLADDDEAMLADFEDDAMMQDDEDAMLADFEDDAMMQDDEDAMLADFEDDAMMQDDEDAFLMDDEEEAMMAKYLARQKMRRQAQKNRRRPRQKARRRTNGRIKSLDPVDLLAENRALRRRNRRLEMMEAPGESTRGIKGVQVVTDQADREGAYKSAFWMMCRQGESWLDQTHKYILKKGEQRWDEGPDSVKSFIGGRVVKGDAYKALNISTAGSVGFGVPEDFVAELNKHIMVQALMAQDCKVRNTSSDRIRQPFLPTSDARRAYAGRVSHPGESPALASEHAATEIALGMIEVPMHLTLINMPATLSSLEDVAFDLQAEISEVFSEAIAVDYEENIWFGDGVGKMSGITNDSRVTGSESTAVSSVSGYIKSGAANGIKSGDEIIKMKMQLPPGYRNRAKWYMNSQTATVVKTLKDGNGRYLWGDEQGLNRDIPSVLLERPIVYNEFAPDIAANAFPLIFGALDPGYLIGKRVEFSIRRFDDSAYAVKDQCLFLGRARYGGQVVRPEAFKLLKITT